MAARRVGRSEHPSGGCRMSARTLAAVAAALLIFPAAAQAKAPIECANTDALPTAGHVEQIGDAELCLHHQRGGQHTLAQLKENTKLQKAGTTLSDENVDEGYFDQTAPDGTTFVDRIL